MGNLLGYDYLHSFTRDLPNIETEQKTPALFRSIVYP